MDPSCLVSTVQAGGGGVMVWGIFSWHTLGPLVPIEYIYIYAVKVNALMQIYFNATNFINAARIFCLTHGPSRSWRNGDAQSCQLSSIADPFSYFFPFEIVPKPFHFWKSPVLLHERQVLLSQRRHTILSLSLCGSALFSERRREVALSVKHRYYVASLILHASIAEIRAQLLSLSYVYLISSDGGSVVRIFVQINILEGSWLCSLNGSRFNHYFILIPLSDNRSVKYIHENSFIENLAASKYSMWAQRGKQM